METDAGTEHPLNTDTATAVVAVYAHAYLSGSAAMNEFKRFDKWSRRRCLEVSFWRARTGAGEWCVVVAEDGDGVAFREFPWRGRLVELPPFHVLAFAERRLEWLASRQAAGRHGSGSDTFHYGEAVAPRLSPNGEWEIPPPPRG